MGARQREDQDQQTGRGDHLADQMPAARAVLGREVGADLEHHIGQHGTTHRTGDLGDAVAGHVKQA